MGDTSQIFSLYYVSNKTASSAQTLRQNINATTSNMDARISQETHQNAAQQLRQWASTRNVPQAQLEQMVSAVLSGQHDAQILQAMPSGQNNNPLTQQNNIFAGPNPPFTFQTPFGTVPMPSIPPMPIPTAPNMCPPPASMVPNMFPIPAVQANPQVPVSESTRTVFPGGEALQQNSSYSGQQGNTTFQYSSSSTSMTFTLEVQMPVLPPPLMQMQQPAMPIMPQPTIPLPRATMPQLAMPDPAHYQPPQPSTYYIQPQDSFSNLTANFPPPVIEVPEPIFNPAAAEQAPQNPRLAGKLKQKLDEATYFSDVPGMPDRSVRRSNRRGMYREGKEFTKCLGSGGAGR